LSARGDYIAKVLANVTTGVLSQDVTGRIASANPAAARILDLPGLQAGVELTPLMDAREDLVELRQLLFSPLKPDSTPLELRVGPERDRHLRVVRLALAAGGSEQEGSLTVIEDITELVRTKKLEAWAELASRIAHEIKNPLTPIQLATEHLRSVFRDGKSGFAEVLEQCTTTILRQVRDLRNIASEFSGLGTKPERQRTPVQVSALLQSCVEMYQGIASSGVRMQLDIEDGLADLNLDIEAIRRALVNLIENALQAMPEGGELSLVARNHNIEDMQGVQIRVQDTGRGIPEEVRSRLFQPYFSTKETGTGLGLVIVKKTMEDHAGQVTIESTVGRGTSVNLFLPNAPDRPSAG
jgi:two-component system nitrogen regulation sensor histidine kinase NtrY